MTEFLNDLSRRRFLAGAAAASVLTGVTRAADTPPELPERVKNVNTTSIRAAVELACQTMSHVFNADDHDIPFFLSTVWPKAELSFYENHTESHVPGRHLNALLNAEDALGVKIDETAVQKHAKAAFFSYSGPVALPLNRDRIGGKLIRFLPHNIREGFHALYALVKYRKSARARELAERSIADINKYWNPETGWDKATLEGKFGLFVGEWGSPFMTGIARSIGPLVKYYRATGYGPALELAVVLKEKAVGEFFVADGSYNAEHFGTHVHSTTCTMSGLAQLAELTNDSRLLERVKKFYDNGLKEISDDIGWSIENSSPNSIPDRGEANNTGDVLETALILGHAGYAECYQRAERILRGHLLPCQLRDISFIHDQPNPKNEDGKRNIAQRHLGAFGFPAPYGHKPVGAEEISFNMDIVGGATGSLCEAYRQTTVHDAAGHHVNLLFDHETSAIRVRSPYSGGAMSVTVLKPGPLFVRIPDWVSASDVHVEGLAEQPKKLGGWIVVASPTVGKALSVRFPLRDGELALRHRTHQIHARTRGDSIVAMENFGAPLEYFDTL